MGAPPQSRSRRESLLAWTPVVARYLGLTGVVFVALVWLLTNRIEPTLLATFGSLIGLGEAADAAREALTRPAESPKRPPPESERPQ